MRFLATLSLMSLTSLSLAMGSPGALVPLQNSKRQDIEPGSPLYECHAHCGGIIVDSETTGYCTNSTYSTDLEDCLECALSYDIWQYYGTEVASAASACGDEATPSASSATAAATTAVASITASGAAGVTTSANMTTTAAASSSISATSATTAVATSTTSAASAASTSTGAAAAVGRLDSEKLLLLAAVGVAVCGFA